MLIKCSNNQHSDTYHVPGIVLNAASELLRQLHGVRIAHILQVCQLSMGKQIVSLKSHALYVSGLVP